MNHELVQFASVSAPANLPRPIRSRAVAFWSRLAADRNRIDKAVQVVLLAIAAIFFVLHFLHLNADFPNNSPWVDWAKYTDEGWYGDAAIRHYLTGHWYWKGDFNPAVALPVWPALELLVFRVTGVSPAAARLLTLGVFALTLVSLYRLIARHTRFREGATGQSLAAPLTVLLLCTSPFVYVFERMAVLEPLLIALGVLALLAASHLNPLTASPSLSGDATGRWSAPGKRTWATWLPTVALTLLLPAMVLTKTTAICLLPGIAYMIWARAGYRIAPAVRLAALPALLGTALWCGYYFLFVRPHYLEDYYYLFSANAHTGIDQSMAGLILDTLGDGAWIGLELYVAFFVVLALAVFWKPRFFANPLVPSLLLWIGGYLAFLIYHNSLQPRYYLVVAIPITAIVALGLDFLRTPGGFLELEPEAETVFGQERGLSGSGSVLALVTGSLLAAAAVLAIAVPDARMEWGFVQHPTYDFQAAAQAIKRTVLADKTHSHLILGISGSDLTLMTGLPSIDDDYGTLDLESRVAQYRPGWFVAWNQVDDDKADALTPLFRLKRVAAFPALDDPDRNLLVLYRLDAVAPAQPTTSSHRQRVRPRVLVPRPRPVPGARKVEH